MDVNTAWQTWGATELKDTACLSACCLQSCHSGHALGSSQPFSYSCSEERCRTCKHQPKETPNNLQHKRVPDTGKSKRRAPCKHPLCPSARLKAGSMISVRGYQTTLRLLSQKSPAAAGKRWCQHGGQLRKMALVPHLFSLLISHAET